MNSERRFEPTAVPTRRDFLEAAAASLGAVALATNAASSGHGE